MQISSPYLSKYILPKITGTSLLDVGCGAGLYGFLTRYSWYRTGSSQKFDKIDAVEFSEESVNNLLKSNIYDNVYLNNAACLPVADESYDTVISIECLEHLYADEAVKAIKELYRVCKKRLIISTPPPSAIANVGWCISEIERINNIEFMSFSQYMEYITRLHKSCMSPDMFKQMGFDTYYSFKNGFTEAQLLEGETCVYFADKKNLNLDLFKVNKGSNNPQVSFVKDKNYKNECITALKGQESLG